MLDEDIDVAKAVSVLKDAPGYKKILTVSKWFVSLRHTTEILPFGAWYWLRWDFRSAQY
jgi:hypothetical protein